MGSVVLGFALPAQALEDDVQACAVAYEQAQVTRNAGQLLEAQEHLRLCVRDVCPEFVKVDCGQWLSEVKREMPSVIFVAVDEQGRELSDVQVNVNGKPVLDSLEGKSAELNPGKHEVQFTHQGKTVRQDVIIRQAEKNRVVRAVFSLIQDQDGDGIADDEDACPTEVGTAEHRGCPAPLMVVPEPGGNGLRVGAYVGWGLGAAGLGTFAVAGLLARNTTDEALKACPNGACPNERKEYWKNRERREVVIANTGLAVGAAGVVTGTILFFLSNGERRQERSSDHQVSWAASPIEGGGGMVSVSGGF